MNNTKSRMKICLAAALLAAASTATYAQSTAASGSKGTATPAGMPPGATSAKGDKAAAPTGSGMATDPATGSTPGMPPTTTDGAATPKGKGNGHSKHMKHGDSAASDAGTTTP